MRYFYFNPPVLVKHYAVYRMTLIARTFMLLTHKLIRNPASIIIFN